MISPNNEALNIHKNQDPGGQFQPTKVIPAAYFTKELTKM